MFPTRPILIWGALAAAIVTPAVAAALSPLLAWRQPIYIAAGFAGIAGMVLLLVQPLLAGRILLGLTPVACRRWHRRVGIAFSLAVALHVAGLWLTSPPDVIDALLFASPTPFSAWGVVAMWAAFAAVFLGLARRRLALRFRVWRLGHASLAAVTIMCSVVHAMLIEGTMEVMTKTALCVLVVVASAAALVRLRVWQVRGRA